MRTTYLLACLTLSLALPSCETYNAMRQDPALKASNATSDTAQPAQPSEQVAPGAAPSASTQPASSAPQPTAKTTRSERPSNNGPFIQPDVFQKMPTKDDLKESATSTPRQTGGSGLTVPKN